MAKLRIVDGFMFHSEEEYQSALKEQKAVTYLKQQMSGKNATEILRIYNQLLEQKLFHTEVGYSFLHDIYVSLQIQKTIPNNEIPAIDIERKVEKVPEKTPVKKERNSSSSQVKTLRVMVIALLVVVVGMFVITLTGSNPTILDYETKIQNKYATWEQQLTEREAAVSKREAELNQQ
ncbi:MAG: hypothetical protein K5675_00690 [Lachnospiraceae bacterium]|nr:hypothetical protein [Lachnospiraceae bacterium]